MSMVENREILVWDMVVRVVHWSLVLLCLLAYLSSDDGGVVHRALGVAILLLVIVRLVWGVVGTHYARFSQFVRSPLKGLAYLRDLPRGKAARVLGHNPAAAWMTILLLGGLLALCLSGLMIRGERWQGGWGLFSGDVVVGQAWADDGHRRRLGQRERDGQSSGEHAGRKEHGLWKEVHEALAASLVVLIMLHTAGVAASSLAHRENLVKSMFTGRKALGR